MNGQGDARFWTGSAITVVGVLAALYTVSMFLRNSVGVIAPDIARDLGLSASDLGFLSSIFFFAFAAVQIPLGMALDRFGPKRCMLVCAAVVIAGAVVFATAPNPSILILGRALFGVGSSCYLMAPLALYARRFPPQRFAMLTAIQLGVGSLGSMFATAPLARLAAAVGWRTSFLVVGAVMLVFAALTAFVVRAHPTDASASRRESLGELLAGLAAVTRTPGVWRLFAMNFTSIASFGLVAGLWGGPYLTHVYGLDLRARGDVLLVMGVAQVIGMLAFGASDRLFGSYKVPVLIGSGAVAILLGFLAVGGVLPKPGLVLWFGLFGWFTAFTPVLISHGKTLFPSARVGRGITLLNLAAMLGTFTTQIVSGVLMDRFPADSGVYPIASYRLIFAAQAIAVVVSILFYLKSPDERCSSATT